MFVPFFMKHDRACIENTNETPFVQQPMLSEESRDSASRSVPTFTVGTVSAYVPKAPVTFAMTEGIFS